MMSHRKLLPPTNIRRTLSNRKATPLSLTGEVSMQHVYCLLFTYNPVLQDFISLADTTMNILTNVCLQRPTAWANSWLASV